jgi:ABC-type uncharacterized transport system permease subunit
VILLFLAQTLRIAVPFLFAAAGGALSERAGVVALALEGFMLGGAFGAIVGTHYTGSPWIGVVSGIAAGLVLGGMHAVASIRFKADQVVTGVAINLFTVVSGTLALVSNPLVWMGAVTIPVLGWVISRTTFGLRVRAVGEHPQAAASVGVPVARVRYAAVLASGALAALGGVYLALDQHQFTDNMTAGRGFIALAAVIFGRWQPVRVGIACLLFAAAETMQVQLQAAQLIPSQFVAMIPYVLTIVAVAGVVGRSQGPAALNRPD